MPDARRPLLARCTLAALAFGAAFVHAAATPPVGDAKAAGTTPDANAPHAAAAVPTLLKGPELIQLLDQTIDWYRTLGIQQQTANEPSDLLILNDNRQTASRIVSLAVEFARADADMLAKQPATASSTASDAQPLQDILSKFTAQSDQAQAELAKTQRQLATARGNAQVELKAKVSELQGEIALLDTRKGLLTTMLAITNDNDASGANSLKAQIDAMAITVPASSSAAPAAAATPAAPATGGSSAAPAPLGPSTVSVATRFGIWDLAANVFRLSEKIVTIDNLDTRTANLQAAFAKIRDPLVAQVRTLSSQGDALAKQADTSDAATLTKIRAELDELSDEIKEASALLIPLGKEGVLMAQYRRNLANWRGIIQSQYNNALGTLGLRVLILAALLGVVFAAAEFWRRAVLHYIRDTRRRYQLLLLRKIALWSLTIVIVGFAFASELGSLVTFAGLITAGLAVAMQSVLVSIVGYFFLIGKYGIRIGDRVQFGDVVGEVIELGLVRLHLLELGAHGQAGPTGRVVAFANAIVFQVSSGLFKQIPGVNFAWHDIVLTLPAGVDYGAAKAQLLAAVNAALKDSHDEIARQTVEIQKTAAFGSGADLAPRVQLNITSTGVEARIRYPVHLNNAAEIDDRISQELLPVVEGLLPKPESTSKT